MKKNRLMIIVTLLFLVAGLAGCKKESFAHSYNIYYTNNEANKLVSVSYGTNQSDTDALISELFNKMNATQKSDDVVVIKKENVSIDSFTVSNHTLNIYYSQEYNSMEISRQALYRGAVVKTFTQVEGIESVMFYVNGTPVTYSDGTTIGTLSAADFIDNDDNNASNLQWSNLTLYFANSKGDKLVKNDCSVAYSRDVSIERAIVEQLIKGPESKAYCTTLPENLKLLNVSVKDGICYVNLDAAFLTEIVNVSSTVPIYSIVNSLCELENIDKVQFLINGDSKKIYRESISLDAPFVMNKDIVTENN